MSLERFKLSGGSGEQITSSETDILDPTDYDVLIQVWLRGRMGGCRNRMNEEEGGRKRKGGRSVGSYA